jgi:hypothetical protein
MPPRYTVRRERDATRYSVWDNEKNKLALRDGRECTDLEMLDAFDTADDLNDQNVQPNEK